MRLLLKDDIVNIYDIGLYRETLSILQEVSLLWYLKNILTFVTSVNNVWTELEEREIL